MKLGLHNGPASAVTLNEPLDYFGTTVNIASCLEGQAQRDDLIISEDVMRQPAVQRMLGDNDVQVETFKARLKGLVNEEFQLYRISLRKQPHRASRCGCGVIRLSSCAEQNHAVDRS